MPPPLVLFVRSTQPRHSNQHFNPDISHLEFLSSPKKHLRICIKQRGRRPVGEDPPFAARAVNNDSTVTGVNALDVGELPMAARLEANN